MRTRGKLEGLCAPRLRLIKLRGFRKTAVRRLSVSPRGRPVKRLVSFRTRRAPMATKIINRNNFGFSNSSCVRFLGRSGHALVHCICLLLTQSEHSELGTPAAGKRNRAATGEVCGPEFGTRSGDRGIRLRT